MSKPIDKKKVKALTDAFNNKKGKALDLINSLTQDCKYDNDPRYTYYSLDDLETYIKSVRASGKGFDGIKLCLGQYDNDNGPSSDYNGLTTILLVPTKKIGPNQYDDLDSKEEDDSGEGGYNMGGTKIPPGVG